MLNLVSEVMVQNPSSLKLALVAIGTVAVYVIGQRRERAVVEEQGDKRPVPDQQSRRAA